MDQWRGTLFSECGLGDPVCIDCEAIFCSTTLQKVVSSALVDLAMVGRFSSRVWFLAYAILPYW